MGQHNHVTGFGVKFQVPDTRSSDDSTNMGPAVVLPPPLRRDETLPCLGYSDKICRWSNHAIHCFIPESSDIDSMYVCVCHVCEVKNLIMLMLFPPPIQDQDPRSLCMPNHQCQ